jgi:rhodanese-related sulfurtransferase
MAKSVSIDDVLRNIMDQSAEIVDVLDPESYDEVHIRGAINIPIKRLEKEASEKISRDKPIVTYSIDYECPISKMAAEKLEEMGYSDVSYYSGGKKEWIAMEMPVD